jgi:predicted XRE-type DNA-binding protein
MKQREIAALFDISRESVGLIVQRRRWSHVA